MLKDGSGRTRPGPGSHATVRLPPPPVHIVFKLLCYVAGISSEAVFPMKRPITLLVLLGAGFGLGFGLARAEEADKVLIRLEKQPPYGSYTPGPGRWYGHNKNGALNNGEARRILIRYFEPRGLRVGRLSDRKDFFQTDVYRGDVFVDRIIIHKTSGRIRSVY